MIFKLWLDDPRVGLGWRHFLVLSRGPKWVRLLSISSFDTLKLSTAKFDAYKPRPIFFPRTRLLKRLRANAEIYNASKSLRAEALRAAAAILPPAKGAAGMKTDDAPKPTQTKDSNMKSASSYSARSAALRAMKNQQLAGTHEVKAAGDRFTIVPKAAAAKAPKPEKAPKAAKATAAPEKSKKLGQRAQIVADAEAGKLPPIPDFSAETHTRFRPKLAELVALVKAKDVKGLKAYPINPISTSPKAMDRYRNLSVIALEAQAKGQKQAA